MVNNAKGKNKQITHNNSKNNASVNISNLEIFDNESFNKLLNINKTWSLDLNIKELFRLNLCKLSRRIFQIITHWYENCDMNEFELLLFYLARSLNVTKYHYWDNISTFLKLLDTPCRIFTIKSLKETLHDNSKLTQRTYRFTEIFVPLSLRNDLFNYSKYGQFEYDELEDLSIVSDELNNAIADVTDTLVVIYKIYDNNFLKGYNKINNKFDICASELNLYPKLKKFSDDPFTVANKKRSMREQEIQKRLELETGGKHGICPAGIADIVSDQQLIEIKCWKLWKHAIGQLLVYKNYFPNRQLRIHLFGEKQKNQVKVDIIRKTLEDMNIILTDEP